MNEDKVMETILEPEISSYTVKRLALIYGPDNYNYKDIPAYLRKEIKERKRREKREKNKAKNIYVEVKRNVNNLSHLRRIDPLFEDDPYREVQMENIGAIREEEEERQKDYE